MKTGIVKISKFKEGIGVFSPEFYLSKGKKTISDIIDKGYEYKPLSAISDKLYQGGIFTRVFIEDEDKALKYITASDMIKANPERSSKLISKKYTPWISEMTLKKNQILVSCAGTIGNILLVNKSTEGLLGSQEIIRLESSELPIGFLYAYLRCSYINSYMQSMAYGAVIPRISPEELGRLPVLIFDKTFQKSVDDSIQTCANLRTEAHN